MKSLRLGQNTKLIYQYGNYCLQLTEDKLRVKNKDVTIHEMDTWAGNQAIRQKARYAKTGEPIDLEYQELLHSSQIWRVVHTVYISKEMLRQAEKLYDPSYIPAATLSNEYKYVHVHVTFTRLDTGVMYKTVNYVKPIQFVRPGFCYRTLGMHIVYWSNDKSICDIFDKRFTRKQMNRILAFVDKNSGPIVGASTAKSRTVAQNNMSTG